MRIYLSNGIQSMVPFELDSSKSRSVTGSLRQWHNMTISNPMCNKILNDAQGCSLKPGNYE